MSIAFEDVIYHLQHNPQAGVRAQAAQMLGEHVASLTDAQYDSAREALNQALADPDPQVLMTAMQALSHFNRHAADYAPAAAPADSGTAVQAAACRVCGRPEALVDAATCEYDTCPYRA
ncbi:MAG: HEAT repeat domain-containing protein [Anaerolineae bacterium]|jgi:hypothetical protein|nr:HEAT repeat domain-containing protein [Anaerolineae bacterium]